MSDVVDKALVLFADSIVLQHDALGPARRMLDDVHILGVADCECVAVQLDIAEFSARLVFHPHKGEVEPASRAALVMNSRSGSRR